MARINHRKLKSVITDKVDKMTDKELFLSRFYSSALLDIAEAMTGRYDIRKRLNVNVIWDESEDAPVAFTNGNTITINAINIFNKDSGRESMHYTNLGLLLHEVGHLLYTDFKEANESAFTFQNKNRIDPIKKKSWIEDDLKDFEEYLETIRNPQLKNAALKIKCDILNILEDAFVNTRVAKKFPGYGKHLDHLQVQMYEEMPELHDLILKEKDKEEPMHRLFVMMSLIHCYALFAEIKCESWEYKNDHVTEIGDMMEVIDDAVEEPEAIERMGLQHMVLVMLYPHFKSYMDEMMEKYGNEPETPHDSAYDDALSEAMDSLGGTTTETSGVSSSPSSTVKKEAKADKGEEKETGESSSAEKSDETADASSTEAGETSTEGEKSDPSDESEETSAESESTESENTMNGAPAGESESDEDSKGESGGEKDDPYDVTEGESEERSRAIDQTSKSSTVSSKREGITEKKERESRGYEKAASDIQRILEKEAEMEANEELERERKHELNDFAASINHSELHRGIDCRVERVTCVDDRLKDQYNEVHKDLSLIVKRLTDRFAKLRSKKKAGGKNTGLYYGKKFEANQAFRRDKKYFSRTTLPTDRPTLSIGLLVDESGSMSCNDRVTYARATALCLYEFCQGLHTKVGVFGHHTCGDTVIINSYAEFESIDKDDKYRIMDICASGGNRDGYALRYVAERLIQQQTDMMLLIIISDGQPAAYGYGGAEACEDLASVVKEYKKKNVTTIAAAIGDDKDTIEAIYQDNFLDISDMNTMPEKLVAIVKKYMK